MLYLIVEMEPSGDKGECIKDKDDITLDYDQYSNLNFFIRAEDTTGLTLRNLM